MLRPRKVKRSPGLCLPGYRWCGPGCSGPGAPLNSVDNCCKRHDDCYRRFGPSRQCDDLFLKCLQSEINPHTRQGRHARLFSNVFRMFRA